MRAKDAIGRYGEQVATDHLRSNGFEILDRNWRCRHGEIDVVAVDGECLVVCEVKTRRSLACGHPFESITPVKAARLRRLAAAWLAHQSHGWPSVRIDAIAVIPQPRGAARVEHLRGVV